MLEVPEYTVELTVAVALTLTNDIVVELAITFDTVVLPTDRTAVVLPTSTTLAAIVYPPAVTKAVALLYAVAALEVASEAATETALVYAVAALEAAFP